MHPVFQILGETSEKDDDEVLSLWAPNSTGCTLVEACQSHEKLYWGQMCVAKGNAAAAAPGGEQEALMSKPSAWVKEDPMILVNVEGFRRPGAYPAQQNKYIGWSGRKW